MWLKILATILLLGFAYDSAVVTRQDRIPLLVPLGMLAVILWAVWG